MAGPLALDDQHCTLEGMLDHQHCELYQPTRDGGRREGGREGNGREGDGRRRNTLRKNSPAVHLLTKSFL